MSVIVITVVWTLVKDPMKKTLLVILLGDITPTGAHGGEWVDVSRQTLDIMAQSNIE